MTTADAAIGTAPSRLSGEVRVFIAAILFRLFTALVAFLANVTFPPLQNQGFTVMRQPHAFWDAFARYDAGWYYGISTLGYSYAEGGRNSLAFFPLYPLLMRGLGPVFGGRQESFYLAGIVISWIAFGFAMLLLYRLARLDLDLAGARRAVMYAAIFPFAYFFGMVYSESLFLLALVGAAYAFRTRRWLLGALAGAAMTATRVPGVMAVPGLAWMAWRAAGDDRAMRLRALAASAATLAGIGGYCAYNYAVSGNPLAWYDSITHWGYHPGGNPIGMPGALLWAVLTRPYQFLALEQMAPYDTLNTVAALGTLAMVPLIGKRFGGGYALIVLGGLLLPMSSAQFEGLGRYCSVQFPLAIVLASLRGDTRHQILLAAFGMLYAICLALFVTVHPLF